MKENTMIRKPAVAGQFYPSSSSRLAEEVKRMMKPISQKQKAIGIVSPHAGYIYSGWVAGEVFSHIEVSPSIIILCPNHTGMGADGALMASGIWQMPGGDVAIDSELAAKILANSKSLKDDPSAHLHEHSIEVQLPFIQACRNDFKFVPIALGRVDLEFCKEIGFAVSKAIKQTSNPVLIVASTDMTHYETHESAKKKDSAAIDEILKLNPERLYKTVKDLRISMCGVGPTVAMLYAAKELGAKEATLIRYMTSGETSGDYSHVVGYAGIIIK